MEKQFYDQVLELLTKYDDFDLSRAKYFERMFSGILQIQVYLGQIKTEKYLQELFPRYKALLHRELQRYNHRGISWETKFSPNDNDAKTMIALFHIKHYYKILGYFIARTGDSEQQLEEASTYLHRAQSIKVPVPGDFNLELVRSKYGILQRLKKEKEAFHFLEMSLQNPLDSQGKNEEEIQELREDLLVHFEDVLLGADYKTYQEGKAK